MHYELCVEIRIFNPEKIHNEHITLLYLLNMEKGQDQKPDSCRMCGRRNFLFKLAALTGASMISGELLATLPMPVPANAMPDKNGAVKVRILFSYHGADVQDRPDWPNIGYDFRPFMSRITDALNAGVKDVEFIPTKTNSSEDAKKIIEEDDQKGDIVGYVVCQMNCWNSAIAAVAEAGKPVLYIPLTYGGDGGWLLSVSLFQRDDRPFEMMTAFHFEDVVGMAQAFAVLKDGTPMDFKQKAKAWRIEHTPKTCQAVAKADHVKCLPTEKALAKLKGMKILSVQNSNPDLFQKIEKDFGIQIEVVSFTDVDAKADQVNEKKAWKLANKWKNEARAVEAVSDDVLFGCAKMYYGMEQILKEHKAQAITINCLGGCYTGKLKNYPCLGFMQLQDDGLFGVCEDDIDATVTMMVFHTLTKGRMGYVSDPALDITKRSIVYAHCVSTRKYFGKKGKQCPYEILTHSEDRQGASVRTIAPEGYPVTTLKFNIWNGAMSIHTAVTTGNDPDDRACRTKIVAEVTGDYEKMYHTWDWGHFGWHRVTFLGDFAQEAVALAHKIGYKVDYES